MAFRLFTSQQALILKIVSENLLSDDIRSFLEKVNQGTVSHSLIMLDLSKVKVIIPQVLKELAELGRYLAGRKQRVMVIGDRSIIGIIERSEYSQDLPCYIGVQPIVEESEMEKQVNSEVDSGVLMSSVGPAVRENLKTYAKVEVQLGVPVVSTQDARPEVDIVGVGSFFCDQRQGSLLLGFRLESYLKLVSKIVKREFSSLQPEISDWAAELVNSILGKVKTDMKAKGFTFSAGIPTTFLGKDLDILVPKKLVPQLNILSCTGAFGECFLELTLSPSMSK